VVSIQWKLPPASLPTGKSGARDNTTGRWPLSRPEACGRGFAPAVGARHAVPLLSRRSLGYLRNRLTAMAKASPMAITRRAPRPYSSGAFTAAGAA